LSRRFAGVCAVVMIGEINKKAEIIKSNFFIVRETFSEIIYQKYPFPEVAEK
jgi:hypothetical protein